MASGEELNQNSREQGEDVAHKMSITRAVGYVAGLGLLAAPVAAYYGISHASADDYLGANKAHFSITTDKHTTVDFGPIGELEIPIHKGIFGVKAEIKGIQVNTQSPSDISTLFSDETITQYATLYGDPEQAINGVKDLLVEDAIKKSIAAEAIAIAGIAVLIGGGRAVVRDDLQKKYILTPITIAGLLAIEAATFASITTVPLPSKNEETKTVTSFNGTYFEGSSTADEPLKTILERIVPTIKNLGKRQNDFLKEYQATAKASFMTQQDAVAVPRIDEEVIMTFSDLHCSYAMIPLLKNIAELYQPSTVISAGDDTNYGSALENDCIQREKTIIKPSDLVIAGGNHDSKTTEKQMSDAGMKLLHGETIENNNTTILGDDDPEITPPLTSGYRVFEDEEETETELGTRILKKAIDETPDVVVLHQPTAVQPIIDYIDNPDTQSRITSLVLNGHTHRRNGPNIIWNKDGTWTIQYQMGTAGGVGTATLTSFSTPFSKPLTEGETTIFFKDKEKKLITGYQIIAFHPDGTVKVNPRVDVGTDIRQ
jgi:predicted phosphodiesterase